MHTAKSKKNKSLLSQSADFIQQGAYAKATDALEKHLKTNPYDSQAWAQRALILILTGKDELALEAANIALRIDKDNADASSMQGSALMQLGRFEEALNSYTQVVLKNPLSAMAIYNKGNALRRLGKIDEAILCIEKSLQLDPHYTNALTVMGSLQQAKGNLATALELFNTAIKRNPRAADAHYNRGLLHLATENFSEGWRDYQWRLRWDAAIRQGQSRAVDRLAPDWHGESTKGPILVLPEQGLGDQIFYGGMLGDLQQRVPGSTVCLVPRLLTLFARSFPNLQFLSPEQINTHRDAYKGKFSAQIHLASLGQFFRNDTVQFQEVVNGYLTADQLLAQTFRTALSGNKKLVCGISWRSKNHEFGSAKSLTLNALTPLLSMRTVNFVNLQYGDTVDEVENFRNQTGLSLSKIEHVDNFQDIDALASVISACDIVVTVSNTTAHLAAALGKPVLVMLPNSPSLFWYWHLNRTDSPWYPSAVLLRQNIAGEWSDVVSTAAMALREYCHTATA